MESDPIIIAQSPHKENRYRGSGTGRSVEKAYRELSEGVAAPLTLIRIARLCRKHFRQFLAEKTAAGELFCHAGRYRPKDQSSLAHLRG